MDITKDLISIIKKKIEQKSLTVKEQGLVQYVTGKALNSEKPKPVSTTQAAVSTGTATTQTKPAEVTPPATPDPAQTTGSIFDEDDFSVPQGNSKPAEKPEALQSLIEQGASNIPKSLESIFGDDSDDMPITPPNLTETVATTPAPAANPAPTSEITTDFDSFFD